MPEHKFIIRYISLGKFIEMLDSKSLHLGRIDLFEDKTEGEWYAHLAKEANKVFSDIIATEDMNKDEYQLVKEINSLKERSYISAWFASDYLSIAMWKLYGITDEGIAIRVKKEVLESIEKLNQDFFSSKNAEIVFNNVLYVENDPEEMKTLFEEHLTNNQKFKFRNLLLKHKAYKFEEEYRMAVVLPEGEEEYPLGIKLSIGDNLNNFIDSIFLNPLIHSNHWYIEVIKKVLQLFQIEPDKLKLGEIKTDFTKGKHKNPKRTG